MAPPVKHGVSKLLKSGLLPVGMEHIARESGRLKRALEEAVLTLRSNITLYEVALIKSAALHEATIRMLGHYLRNESGITLDQRLAILRDVRSATNARDKSIEQLNINIDPRKTAIDSIYSDGDKS